MSRGSNQHAYDGREAFFSMKERLGRIALACGRLRLRKSSERDADKFPLHWRFVLRSRALTAMRRGACRLLKRLCEI